MVGLGSFRGSGKARDIAVIATPLPSKVTLRGAVRARILDMCDPDGEGATLAKDGDMDEDGGLKQEDGSGSGSDDLIIQTASDSVVATIVLGMLFTALLAWTRSI